VHPDAGPLFYYPGSHRIPPYVFSHGGIHAVDAEMPECRAYLDREIASRNLKKELLFGKKGDIFLWHAQLLHGGSPINDLARTRSSLVVHYWGLDAIQGAALATSASGGKFLDRNYWETDGRPIEQTQRTASSVLAAPKTLPPDFDARQYLLANPDVAKAGVDAAEHYLRFGHGEGRKLRPA